MSFPEERIHEEMAASAEHLMTLMNGGASVFTFMSVPGTKPLTFDLSNREDLIAVTRFHLRHMVAAYRDMRIERDVAETLGDDLINLVAEDLMSPLDRDKTHLFATDEMPDIPKGLFDND